MANWNPPTKNADFEFDILLQDYASPGNWKSNPTLASGDFKIIKDGGAEANLATLPTVTPASGRYVRVQVSATEMNADKVTIAWADQTTPKEWADGGICILTTTT
jgi:hypothetical protein